MADREKSALYPAYTIDECVKFIEVINSLNSKIVSYSAVAEKYGLSSVTTKSFTQKIGSAKQYGLITTSSSTIQITEHARNILYPIANDIGKLYCECFKLPPLYSALIDRYNGKAIPNESILANLLMSDYKISKVAKDNAARVFIENAEHLGFIKAGVFNYSNDGNEESKESGLRDESEDINESHSTKNEEISAHSRLDLGNESDYIIQSYPVESGKIAKICIPIDSTEDDLYAIRDLLDIIMKRKFKINL